MELGARSERTLCRGTASRRGGMQRDIAHTPRLSWLTQSWSATEFEQVLGAAEAASAQSLSCGVVSCIAVVVLDVRHHMRHGPSQLTIQVVLSSGEQSVTGWI